MKNLYQNAECVNYTAGCRGFKLNHLISFNPLLINQLKISGRIVLSLQENLP